jgi:hypothetical protein
LSIKFRDWVCKKPLEHLFPALPNIYPCWDIKLVSELYGQGIFMCVCAYIPFLHKGIVQFQKLIQHLFLTLHGQNIHYQQWELSTFLIHHQQFPSQAYCGAAGPVSKMASQLKAFCVLRSELPRSVTTVQREFRARFKKVVIRVWCVIFKSCTKLTLHCSHRSGHIKTQHTEILLLLRRHLGNWSLGPAVSMRSKLLVAHEELGQFPLFTMYVVHSVGWDIFLITFETSQLFCVYPVYIVNNFESPYLRRYASYKVPRPKIDDPFI